VEDVRKRRKKKRKEILGKNGLTQSPPKSQSELETIPYQKE
jgi:hypothetical protein